MTKSSTKFTKFVIKTKVDPELGGFGQTAEVVTWVPVAIRDSDPDYLESTKAELQATFAKLWNDPLVTVEVDPFTITTTHEIKPNHMHPKDGSLTIRVCINGEEVGTVQAMSGPLADIKEFVAGEIGMAEVSRRWSRRR